MERRLRLRESSDIKRVRARGMAVAEGPFVARVLPNRLEPPQNRYTVVAGKKQGNAVKRNRVKRLAREALRHLDPLLVTGVDVLVLVRGKAEEVPDYATARALLDRIVARAGLLAESKAAGNPVGGANVAGREQERRSTGPAAEAIDGERGDGERAQATTRRPAADASAVPVDPRPASLGDEAAGSAIDAAGSAGVRSGSPHVGADGAGRARSSHHDRQVTRQGTGPSPTTGDPPDDVAARREGAR